MRRPRVTCRDGVVRLDDAVVARDLDEVCAVIDELRDVVRRAEDEEWDVPTVVDDDPSPECRCETCPRRGPFTCISRD